MKKSLLLALVFSVFSIALEAKAETPVFRFTAQPDQDEAILANRFGRLAAYLQQCLSVQVRYVPAKSYRFTVKAFIQNDVQMGWFGAYHGIQARQAVEGSEAIAQTSVDANFKSYFIANVSAGLKQGPQLQLEMRGKTFTFGAPDSTSGRLMPEYFIRTRFGAGPKDIFSKVGFSGDHAATLRLVQSGEYDVGSIDFSVYERKKKAGEVDESKVSVIWESPPFPNNQFSIRGDVDQTFGPGFKTRVKQALLDLSDADLMKLFNAPRFIEANNDLYKPIENVVRLAKVTD